MSQLEEQIINLISKTLVVEKEQIQRQTHFFQDLNADKMAMADLFLAIAEQLRVNLPTKELETVQTVDELIKLVEDHGDEFI